MFHLRHVIAASRQFDQTATLVASLPLLFLGQFYQLLSALIARTVFIMVCFGFAQRAGLRATRWTGSDVALDVVGWNPSRAQRLRAVRPVLCQPFWGLFLETFNRLMGKQASHSDQRNLDAAAAWRIQSLVFDRAQEEAVDAGGAVIVATRDASAVPRGFKARCALPV